MTSGGRSVRLSRTLLAGLLVAAAMPPWGWWPLAFLGLAMFSSAERAAPSARRRFVTGVVFGCGWFFPAMSWMWFLTPPGYVVAVLIFASLHGLVSVIAVRPSSRSTTLITAPAGHALIEAIRLSFPFGGVPLATLGISQVAGPLRHVASLGGVILITWLTWQIGALLNRGHPRTRRSQTLRRAVVAICVLIYIAGLVDPNGSDTGRAIRVVAVQGGGPQGTRAITTNPRDVVVRHLQATRTIATPSADDAPIDLVVWPENVIDVADFETSPEFDEVLAEARRLDAPIAVGITEDVDDASFTNAQVVITRDGAIHDRYDKVRRVPFGEYMPMRGLLDTLGAPVDQVPRDAVAGTGLAYLDIPIQGVDERASVAISWEIFFGGRVREGVEEGAGFVLNPTNGSSYTWTVLQSQQVASSRLRAQETGRWVVQVSPTGFSAVVDPEGRVYDRTRVSEQAVLDRVIQIRSGATIYVSLGDGPWIVLLLAVTAGGLLAPVIVRRGPYKGRR
ncbi:MAG: apolipoprotein N-acyltransferase [Ilumatobacteraceae bacterium]